MCQRWRGGERERRGSGGSRRNPELKLALNEDLATLVSPCDGQMKPKGVFPAKRKSSGKSYRINDFSSFLEFGQTFCRKSQIGGKIAGNYRKTTISSHLPCVFISFA